MLVIGRREGEAVYIDHNGERLKITIQRPHRNLKKIQLSFDGPTSFRVIRDDAVEQEQKEQGNGQS